LLGAHEKNFFSLHRLEFDRAVQDDTKGNSTFWYWLKATKFWSILWIILNVFSGRNIAKW